MFRQSAAATQVFNLCFAKGEFRVGYSDACLGLIAGIEFWMGKDQVEYWKQIKRILDVTPERGSRFSLEIPLGECFLERGRVFEE
jgi:uncharacterized protein